MRNRFTGTKSYRNKRKVKSLGRKLHFDSDDHRFRNANRRLNVKKDEWKGSHDVRVTIKNNNFYNHKSRTNGRRQFFGEHSGEAYLPPEELGEIYHCGGSNDRLAFRNKSYSRGYIGSDHKKEISPNEIFLERRISVRHRNNDQFLNGEERFQSNSTDGEVGRRELDSAFRQGKMDFNNHLVNKSRLNENSHIPFRDDKSYGNIDFCPPFPRDNGLFKNIQDSEVELRYQKNYECYCYKDHVDRAYSHDDYETSSSAQYRDYNETERRSSSTGRSNSSALDDFFCDRDRVSEEQAENRYLRFDDRSVVHANKADRNSYTKSSIPTPDLTSKNYIEKKDRSILQGRWDMSEVVYRQNVDPDKEVNYPPNHQDDIAVSCVTNGGPLYFHIPLTKFCNDGRNDQVRPVRGTEITFEESHLPQDVQKVYFFQNKSHSSKYNKYPSFQSKDTLAQCEADYENKRRKYIFASQSDVKSCRNDWRSDSNPKNKEDFKDTKSRLGSMEFPAREINVDRSDASRIYMKHDITSTRNISNEHTSLYKDVSLDYKNSHQQSNIKGTNSYAPKYRNAYENVVKEPTDVIYIDDNAHDECMRASNHLQRNPYGATKLDSNSYKAGKIVLTGARELSNDVSKKRQLHRETRNSPIRESAISKRKQSVKEMLVKAGDQSLLQYRKSKRTACLLASEIFSFVQQPILSMSKPTENSLDHCRIPSTFLPSLVESVSSTDITLPVLYSSGLPVSTKSVTTSTVSAKEVVTATEKFWNEGFKYDECGVMW